MRKYFTWTNTFWVVVITIPLVYGLIFGFDLPQDIGEFWSRFVTFMGYVYIGTWVARLVLFPIFYWYYRRKALKESPFSYLYHLQEEFSSKDAWEAWEKDAKIRRDKEYPNGWGWRHRQNQEQPED